MLKAIAGLLLLANLFLLAWNLGVLHPWLVPPSERDRDPARLGLQVRPETVVLQPAAQAASAPDSAASAAAAAASSPNGAGPETASAGQHPDESPASATAVSNEATTTPPSASAVAATPAASSPKPSARR